MLSLAMAGILLGSSPQYPSLSSSGVAWARQRVATVAQLEETNSLFLVGFYYSCLLDDTTNCVDANAVIKLCDLQKTDAIPLAGDRFTVYSVRWRLHGDACELAVGSMKGEFREVDGGASNRVSLVREGRTWRELSQMRLDAATVDAGLVDVLNVVQQCLRFLRLHRDGKQSFVPLSLRYSAEVFPASGVPFAQERVVFGRSRAQSGPTVVVVRRFRNGSVEMALEAE